MIRHVRITLWPLIIALACCLNWPSAGAADLPNILWITCEDTGPQLGCYGDTYAKTPNLDALGPSGACSICTPGPTRRSAPRPAPRSSRASIRPSTGRRAHAQRGPLPEFMKMYPQLLRERGYYCTNNSKEDYNLDKPGSVWDESSGKAHWRNRRPGQPFFAIFNITVSHESQIRTRPHTLEHDPAKVRCRPIIPTRRKSATTGPSTTTTSPDGRPGRQAAAGTRPTPGWPTTRSSSSTATTAPACRAASAGRTTRACTCR